MKRRELRLACQRALIDYVERRLDDEAALCRRLEMARAAWGDGVRLSHRAGLRPVR